MNKTIVRWFELVTICILLTGYANSQQKIETVTVTGTEAMVNGSWVTGRVTIFVSQLGKPYGGAFYGVDYGQYSTPSSIASGIAAQIAQYCSQDSWVTAYASGPTIYIRTRLGTGAADIAFIKIYAGASDPGTPTTFTATTSAPQSPTTPPVTPPTEDLSCCYTAGP